MDKAFWKSVIDSGFAVPEGYTVQQLTPELVGYLSSTDGELRDEIANSVLVRWLIKGFYSPEEMHALQEDMLAALTVGLGENGTDSVFGRSFAALILAAITYVDNHIQPCLEEADIHLMVDRALAYFASERDLRGFVPGKGWAHSAAHTSDWIDELALSRYSGPAELERILDALADKVMQSDIVFLCEEDERLSVTASSALRRNLLSREAVLGWLAKLSGKIEQTPRTVLLSDLQSRTAYMNSKTFVRSVYFRLLLADDLPNSVRKLVPDVLAAVKAFKPF